MEAEAAFSVGDALENVRDFQSRSICQEQAVFRNCLCKLTECVLLDLYILEYSLNDYIAVLHIRNAVSKEEGILLGFVLFLGDLFSFQALAESFQHISGVLF